MHTIEIVGYTFNADQYHPEHLIETLISEGHASPVVREMNVEVALDQIAKANAINRYEEETFDSGDFPKVIFADQAEGACGFCGVALVLTGDVW